MKQRVLFLALAAIMAAVPALAQDPLDPPYVDFEVPMAGRTCEELKAWCATTKPEDIYDAAKFPPPPALTVGTCYVHDNSGTYPYAACQYVKQSWRSGAKGFDGGTGAIPGPPPPNCAGSRAAAGAVLKSLCETGRCCCPDLPAKEPCFVIGTFKAYDPTTGTCCSFANLCTVPSDWEPILSPDDHRCD